MSFKKHKGLIISGAVLLVVLAVSLFFLRSAWSRYNSARTDLQRLVRSYSQLQNRDPYPSRENVEAERENLLEAATLAVILNNTLRSGQIEPQKMESAEFMPLLERTLSTLSDKFRKAEIKIPDGFLFGFERYARDGSLPDNRNIPKLVQQLRIIEELCDILVAGGITELQSLKREEFEISAVAAEAPQPATGRAASRGARAPETPRDSRRAGPGAAPQELFSAPLRFSIEFRSREASFFRVINKLASDPMFCVIANVEMLNERRGVPAPGAKSVGTDGDAIRSVVIGREGVLAKIEVDVYRFNPVLDKLENLTGISISELEQNVAQRIEAEQVPEETVPADPEEEADVEQVLEADETVEQTLDEQVPGMHVVETPEQVEEPVPADPVHEEEAAAEQVPEEGEIVEQSQDKQEPEMPVAETPEQVEEPAPADPVPAEEAAAEQAEETED